MRGSKIYLINCASNDDFSGIWQFAYFFELKGYFAKKLFNSFCHALAYLPQKYERNRIFDPCRVIFHFYGQGLSMLTGS